MAGVPPSVASALRIGACAPDRSVPAAPAHAAGSHLQLIEPAREPRSLQGGGNALHPPRLGPLLLLGRRELRDRSRGCGLVPVELGLLGDFDQVPDRGVHLDEAGVAGRERFEGSLEQPVLLELDLDVFERPLLFRLIAFSSMSLLAPSFFRFLDVFDSCLCFPFS